jgi:signal transduction histidine kinase
LFAVGTAAAVGLTSIAIYQVLSRRVDDAVNSSLDGRANTIIGTLGGEGPPEFANAEQYAFVLDSQGRPLAAAPGVANPGSVLHPDEIARAIQNRIVINRDVPGLSTDGRLLAKVATVNSQPVIVVTGVDLDPARDSTARLVAVLAAAAPALAAIIAAGAWFVIGAALRPVHQLTAEADTISRADVGRRLPEPATGDEIAELAHTLNAMLDRLADGFRRERAFVDDASHELRTPLAVLQGELELATTGPLDVQHQRAAIDSALDETRRLTQLADDLLVLSRAAAGELPCRNEPVDVAALSRTAVDRLTATDHLKVSVSGNATTTTDPDRLGQILTNLLTNATHWARSRIEVRVDSNDQNVTVTVGDDGPGFPDDFVDHAFDRFTQADTARQRRIGVGTGLGLAIVDALTEVLGGAVRARHDHLGGAAVTVTLPHR